MRNYKLISLAAILTLAIAITSCGNKQAKSETTAEAVESKGMEIDSLLANAETLSGKEVTIQGVCTHTCKHGATKIFLMGSDDTQTIRCEAGELGSFSQNCVNNIVEVTGKLVEKRIDEAYLQQWEEKLKAQTAKKHGNSAAGCDSERKARQEEAVNSPEERITNFRKRIADRNEKEGKNYLSFYFIEATKYQVQE